MLLIGLETFLVEWKPSQEQGRFSFLYALKPS